MLKTKLIKLMVGGLLGVSFVACAATQVATTDIKVAFNQSRQHPQYLALKALSKQLTKETEGRYRLVVYPNEMLGDQRTALARVKNGSVPMAIIASPLLEQYNPTFRIIAMPYIYTGSEHQEKVFNSGILDPLFASTSAFGFDVLTAYTAGARSIYTKNGPVKSPDSLQGMRIRVMQSESMVNMLDCLGATGIPMSQGEAYNAIQNGGLDGAENNEITYLHLKHYEVAPYFSETRHLMVPDLLIISSDYLSGMSKHDQVVLKKLAKASTQYEFTLWHQQINKAIVSAIRYGAAFNQPYLKPFQQRCKSLQSAMIQTPEQKTLYNEIMDLSADTK